MFFLVIIQSRNFIQRSQSLPHKKS
uniref:Uncharacterized protein n=1 Tax=Anguilla anguilla TaxID=7936 RepID=A0A0E9THQ3_ANGAN